MDAGVAAVLAAFIAVLGGLVGGLVSLRATQVTLGHAQRLEKARWDREDLRRHEELRREAYPQFLATSDEGVLVATSFLERGIDFEQRFAQTGWYERQRGTLDIIELVGSEQTIDVARAFDRAVHRLIAGVRPLREEAIAISEERHRAEASEDMAEASDEREGDTSPSEEEVETTFDDDGTEDPEYFDNIEAEGQSGLGGLLEFMKPLPYPLGSDMAPGEMYGGNPGIQIVMARSELRVRRHEYLNAARADLGLPNTPFPSDQHHQWGPPPGEADEPQEPDPHVQSDPEDDQLPPGSPSPAASR
jgi:hypothetical protein